MFHKRTFLLILVLMTSLLSCQRGQEAPRQSDTLHVTATIFPVYDFARNVGGDKVNVTMLLPPGADTHHFDLRPDDIARVTQADVFLFTTFELERWAYKIINAALLAVETGKGSALLPLNHHHTERHADHETKHHDHHVEHDAKFDPHIWLDLNNAQKMVDNIADAFIKKDPRNSDYYSKNALDYKMKLAALDRRYQKELTGCKSQTILHAGHWAFAYLAARYNLRYTAAYNVFADAEPSPQQIFSLIQQIKKQKAAYIYYEDMINPRLAQTIAKETGAGLLRLNNGHDISKNDFQQGETFISLMENNLTHLKKGLQCPQI